MTKKDNNVNRVTSWIRENQTFLLQILLGWLFSRLLLVAVCWFTSFYPVNPSFSDKAGKLFEYTPLWIADIWCRWDAGYYLSLIESGYQPVADLGSNYSNLAFFPFYPWLVKTLAGLIPGVSAHRTAVILIGLLVSNLSFILAMIGLFALTKTLFDEKAAQRTVFFAFCLPGAFFYSALYTESLFLCLAVYACLCAEKKVWAGAGILGMFAALTRSHGFLLFIPLALIYLDQKDWNLRQLGWSWLWLLLIPLAVIAHFVNLYQLTGDFFAFLEAQKAWKRSTGIIPNWQGYARPLFGKSRWVSWVDFAMVLMTILSCVEMFRKKPYRSYAVYGLAAILITATSGNFHSSLRFVIVIFPMLMWMGKKLEDPRKLAAVCTIFGMIQILFFSGWVKYYWIA